METLSDTKVKARKDYVCDYCELAIPKGANVPQAGQCGCRRNIHVAITPEL